MIFVEISKEDCIQMFREYILVCEHCGYDELDRKYYYINKKYTMICEKCKQRISLV